MKEMTYANQREPGNTRWKFTDPLCGAMNANYFSDYMCSFQSQKLAALRTHKKALMQQLFATPEEYLT
jgi:hypothetical protein